jgi:hypothetical protein
LRWLNFPADPAALSQIVKDRFVQLRLLDLIDCFENVRLFIENIPIPYLKFFKYSLTERESIEEIEVLNAAVMNYGGSLVRLNLECYVSSANLIKIVERCPSLINLIICSTQEHEILSLPAFKAIASLPYLNQLEIGHDCDIADGALSSLARCYELTILSLYLSVKFVDLSLLLRDIGRNLTSLDMWYFEADAIDLIVEYCPNLQYLELEVDAAETVEFVKWKLKSGLKKLAKFEVNRVSVRLGTDYKGRWSIDS